MMKPSIAFERFRISCFDNSFGATRDGLDVEAALSLTGNERAEAEALILSELHQTNDSRPFIAAGAMHIGSASPILKSRLLSGFRPGFESLRVHAAHALYQIEKWTEAATTIIDVLNNTPKTQDHQWTRMMAVEALADFAEDPRCHTALFASVEDDDNFIGFLAVKSLKRVFSQRASISALIEVLGKTQVEPNRWKPEYLQQRRLAFVELESATGVQMPSVATEKRDQAQQSAVPNNRPSQLPLFSGVQASDLANPPSAGGCE